jgi:GAF domain-containing protein
MQHSAPWYVPGMSEGIVLDPVPHGSLLPVAGRIARLEQAIPQIEAAVAGETDPIVIQATLACLLWQAMPQTSWCGFYRRIDADTLAVGPYQGTMGCLRIALTRGVCGACARTREVQLVPDVSMVADHIACDDATRSELVLPVIAAGYVHAVLDLDSLEPDAFDRREAALLEGLLSRAFAAAVFE